LGKTTVRRDVLVLGSTSRGSGKAPELGTYVVERGKPLIMLTE